MSRFHSSLGPLKAWPLARQSKHLRNLTEGLIALWVLFSATEREMGERRIQGCGQRAPRGPAWPGDKGKRPLPDACGPTPLIQDRKAGVMAPALQRYQLFIHLLGERTHSSLDLVCRQRNSG